MGELRHRHSEGTRGGTGSRQRLRRRSQGQRRGSASRRASGTAGNGGTGLVERRATNYSLRWTSAPRLARQPLFFAVKTPNRRAAFGPQPVVAPRPPKRPLTANARTTGRSTSSLQTGQSAGGEQCRGQSQSL